jgi:hypothetical protein
LRVGGFGLLISRILIWIPRISAQTGPATGAALLSVATLTLTLSVRLRIIGLLTVLLVRLGLAITRLRVAVTLLSACLLPGTLAASLLISLLGSVLLTGILLARLTLLPTLTPLAACLLAGTLCTGLLISLPRAGLGLLAGVLLTLTFLTGLPVAGLLILCTRVPLAGTGECIRLLGARAAIVSSGQRARIASRCLTIVASGNVVALARGWPGKRIYAASLARRRSAARNLWSKI